jgi:hypothetical protein
MRERVGNGNGLVRKCKGERKKGEREVRGNGYVMGVEGNGAMEELQGSGREKRRLRDCRTKREDVSGVRKKGTEGVRGGGRG